MKFTFAGTLAALFLSTAAYAAPVTLSDMNLNGSSAMDGSSLVLTPSLNSQNGSAYVDSAYAVGVSTTFSAAFELGFSLNGGGGADGIAFVVHNDSSGANQLGVSGGGLGYQGIAPSVVVEFDTWSNGGIDDSSNNHVGIALNGNVDSVTQADPGFTIENQTSLFAWVDYDGTNLEVFVNTSNSKPGTNLLSYAVDLFGTVGSQAYFGFTGSTGGARSKQQVNSFDLEVSAPPVPLPAALPMLATGFALMGGLGLRRRRKAA